METAHGCTNKKVYLAYAKMLAKQVKCIDGIAHRHLREVKIIRLSGKWIDAGGAAGAKAGAK